MLDLGCAPGSWLLYAAKLTGPKGRVIGVDLKPVSSQVSAHIKIITADVFALDIESLGKAFNVVLSDMAPATTGHKAVDAARSYNLCESALNIAQNVFVAGRFICLQDFPGAGFQHFFRCCQGRIPGTKNF